jgi:hypothetical protein
MHLTDAFLGFGGQALAKISDSRKALKPLKTKGLFFTLSQT